MALLTEISNYLWVEQLGQFGGRKHKWKCLLFHRLPEFCPGSGCHIQAKQGKWPESDIRSSISASQWREVSQQACEPQRCLKELQNSQQWPFQKVFMYLQFIPASGGYRWGSKQEDKTPSGRKPNWSVSHLCPGVEVGCIKPWKQRQLHTKRTAATKKNENKENTKNFSPLSEEQRSAWQQRQLHAKRTAAKKKNENKENTKSFSPLSEEQRSLGRWTAA